MRGLDPRIHNAAQNMSGLQYVFRYCSASWIAGSSPAMTALIVWGYDSVREFSGENIMARLRHIAVCVKDLDKAAAFYEKVFEFKKIGREDLDIGSAIYMSDGVINMALLNFTGKGGEKASDIKEGQTFVGAHHFGIQVDDLADTPKRIEAAGGKFFFDLGDERAGNFERKFKDPDGVIFDISKHGWQGTDGYSKK
jgi:catechol 2,3-dioxygenase-like lactoylglutathione lyase family enzyme